MGGVILDYVYFVWFVSDICVIISVQQNEKGECRTVSKGLKYVLSFIFGFFALVYYGIKLGNTPKEYTTQREEYKSFMLVAGIGMVLNFVITSMIGL